MRWSSAFNLSSGRKMKAKPRSTQIAQASCQEISARKAALNASGQTSAKAKLTLAQGGRIQGWRLSWHIQTQPPTGIEKAKKLHSLSVSRLTGFWPGRPAEISPWRSRATWQRGEGEALARKIFRRTKGAQAQQPTANEPAANEPAANEPAANARSPTTLNPPQCPAQTLPGPCPPVEKGQSRERAKGSRVQGPRRQSWGEAADAEPNVVEAAAGAAAAPVGRAAVVGYVEPGAAAQQPQVAPF